MFALKLETMPKAKRGRKKRMTNTRLSSKKKKYDSSDQPISLLNSTCQVILSDSLLKETIQQKERPSTVLVSKSIIDSTDLVESNQDVENYVKFNHHMILTHFTMVESIEF